MHTTIRLLYRSFFLFGFGGLAAAAPCSDPAWCLGDLTRPAVDRAWTAVTTWRSSEEARPYFRTTALAALPLDGTALKPIATGFRPASQTFTNIYGHKGILFAVRHAAQFLKSLYPQLDTLTLMRVDTEYPIRAHPPEEADEHTSGKAADIAYPLSGDGRSGSIDFARTFWLVYAFSKTPGVFAVILDYWDEVQAYGRLAQEQGLVTPDELAKVLRLARADKFRNHDTHMHIDVER